MLLALGLVCATSVALALVAQHRFGMEPCPWCILQRILFIALAAVSLLAAALPQAWGRRLLSALAIPLAGAVWRRHCGSTSSRPNPVHAL